MTALIDGKKADKMNDLVGTGQVHQKSVNQPTLTEWKTSLHHQPRVEFVSSSVRSVAMARSMRW